MRFTSENGATQTHARLHRHVLEDDLLHKTRQNTSFRRPRRPPRRRQAPPAPLSVLTIQEPTLGLLSAAQDECNDIRRITLYKWRPLGRGSSSPEGGRHATATSSGQQLPKECHPSSDPAHGPLKVGLTDY